MSRADLLRFVLRQFFKDASNKSSGLTEDDKYESSRTDSGFLSSGNLLISSELSEEIKPQEDSGVIEEDCVKSEEFMRLDSGIDTCLSQFSSLSMRPGYNDLGKEKCIDIKTAEKPQWEVYFDQDENGDTHLHYSIIDSFPEVALALIRTAPHPGLLDTRNDDAQSPLHLAVATGQYQIARWLIVAGAKPSPRNSIGDSPLHIAARNGDLHSCRSITDPVQQQERDLLALAYPPTQYQHCKFDQWNYDGQTSVHVAALNGHVEVLRHLVWYGADINAREGRGGYTALHYAIERSDEKLMHFLLAECKQLNVEAVTYGGRSALQLGLPVAHTLLEMLLSRGVPSPYTSDDEGDDSEDEIMYEESSNMFKPNLIINASA